eukprot:SAG25_NODE_210_length_11824_cov_35.953092_3_plen_334_part_00
MLEQARRLSPEPRGGVFPAPAAEADAAAGATTATLLYGSDGQLRTPRRQASGEGAALLEPPLPSSAQGQRRSGGGGSGGRSPGVSAAPLSGTGSVATPARGGGGGGGAMRSAREGRLGRRRRMQAWRRDACRYDAALIAQTTRVRQVRWRPRWRGAFRLRFTCAPSGSCRELLRRNGRRGQAKGFVFAHSPSGAGELRYAGGDVPAAMAAVISAHAKSSSAASPQRSRRPTGRQVNFSRVKFSCVLTEIYLCGVCSCDAILRRNADRSISAACPRGSSALRLGLTTTAAAATRAWRRCRRGRGRRCRCRTCGAARGPTRTGTTPRSGPAEIDY